MTGLVCGGAGGPRRLPRQHDASYVFGHGETFDALWARLAAAGGNPLTATPLRRVAGRWYVDLAPAASPGS